MTSVAHRSALRAPRSSGLAARRPLIRWAWRLFRREWRQQILVIALITVAVAAAVTSVTIAYNSQPLDYAEFGSASAILELDGADPRKLEATLAAEKRFGTTDVIAHRELPVPGSVDNVEFRAQDPRTVRRACAPQWQLPGRPRPGRSHRRSRGTPRGRNREDSRPRRPSPNRRRHRREPT